LITPFDPGAKHVNIGKFTILHMGLEHLPIGRRRRAGIFHHERKLEHLGRREPARRIADHCPDDIGDPVDCLVHQLGRGPAKRHGRIPLDLDPASGCLFDIIRPDVQNKLGHIRLRRQELVQPQRDLLRQRARCRERGHGNATHRTDDRSSRGHDILPVTSPPTRLTVSPLRIKRRIKSYDTYLL
jgi:hypothetical protein